MNERETIKCPNPKCGLVQYMTANELCRRCGLGLRPKPEPVVEPAPIVEQKQAGRDSGPEIGRAIKNFREMRRMTQGQLAAKMNCFRTYVSKAENGKLTPTLPLLQAFAQALRVSLAELVDAPGKAELMLRDPFLAEVMRLARPLSTGEQDMLLTIVRSFAANLNATPTAPREAA